MDRQRGRDELHLLRGPLRLSIVQFVDERRHRDECAAPVDVEELMTIPRPRRFGSARGRDLPATAAHLRNLGFSATVDEVATSSQAGAALLAERLVPGSRVLVVGTDALRDEVLRVGLIPVTSAEEEPDAVVQGHSPDTGWNVPITCGRKNCAAPKL